MNRAVSWMPAIWIPGVWAALYYWFIVGNSQSHPLLLWGVGALIVWQITFFITDCPGPIPPKGRDYIPPYPYFVAIMGVIILFLGMIAGWLATTPGLTRVIAAVLIGLENLLVYHSVSHSSWDDPYYGSSLVPRLVKWSFVPIGLLGLAGLTELIGHITKLAECL